MDTTAGRSLCFPLAQTSTHCGRGNHGLGSCKSDEPGPRHFTGPTGRPERHSVPLAFPSARDGSDQLAERSVTRIAACLFEPMRRRRLLIDQAREAAASIRAQCQSGIESRLGRRGRHDSAPPFEEVSKRRAGFPAVGVTTGSIEGSAGTFRGVPRRRRTGDAVLSAGMGALIGAMAGAPLRNARQSSSRMIVRRPIFLARSLPAAIAL
jgi:hypothetical protein